MQGSLPFGLLRFCIEHSDDPANITNLDLNRFERNPEDYEWLIEALDNLESDSGKALKVIVKLSGGVSEDEMVDLLENLQYLVEDLDVAKGLSFLSFCFFSVSDVFIAWCSTHFFWF